MKHKVYTVYDSKLKTYAHPFQSLNKGHAMRYVDDWLKNPEHPFSKYAADFTLFEIGEYDDELGHYQMHEAKEPMGCLLEFKTEKGN